jgi:PAS domain S-box-containing protein
MLLGIRQYAILFGLLIATLVSTFAYQISSNLESTRQKIEESQQTSAILELEHAIASTLYNIRQSADKLSQWQEVKQQISNPELFAYWYNVRFKKYAFDLQKYTLDLMIYDVNGRALARLADNSLPYEINIQGIDAFSFRAVSETDIIYISPVLNDEADRTIIGYLGTRLQLVPLLKSLGSFQHINLDTLLFKSYNSDHFVQSLAPSSFFYDVHKAEGIIILEAQIRESIMGLVLIIVIPTIILYVTLVFIISIPVKNINKYINRLRTDPETINDKNYRSFFQVTELKSVYDSLIRYHTELSQKEEHLSLTLNSIGDAVITTDAENRVVRMNPVAEQLTGWSFAEAQGKPVNQIFNILDASSRKSIDNPFDTVINTGGVVYLSKDTILVSEDGTEYLIADSAAPIRDSSGQIRGMVLVFNDITERKMKDEQLQQSLKMDALGKLTGGIAHDFNNLLGVILGYSELLTPLLNGQAKPLRYAEQIHAAGERARKLTAKLLAFSRKDTAEATVTDLNQLIISEQHLLEKTLTARVELKLQLEENLWPAYLDQGQLRDAIINISINAMHAMPEGGSLTLTTKKTHVDSFGKRHINLEEGDYLQLSIADTGIGMDQNTCRKIFDPFFTTKGDKGTGLGMSQVYGFVQQSGGAIHVNSEPGLGTQVIIYLPRYQSAETVSGDQQDSNLHSQAVPLGNETILVVDDEPALLELCSQILNEHGYHSLAASSGEKALAILENQPVDLLLTDVIMPKMDGYQLAAIVSKKYPSTKIQMVSGYSDDRNKDIDDDQLHIRQLHKPYSSAELLKRVRETLDE